MKSSKTAILFGILVLVLVCAASLVVRGPALRADSPRYTATGELVRPDNYRDWIFLTSLLNMGAASSGEGVFTNVYVEPSAYRQFLANGRWPEQTRLRRRETDLNEPCE